VEPVVHVRAQPQRHVSPVAIQRFERGVAEEVLQAVEKPLGLDQHPVLDAAGSADDGVAGAGEDVRIGIDRTGPRLQFADEAVVHAGEGAFTCLGEVERAEPAPDRNREIPDEGLFDLAEPAHEEGERPARDAVGQQEVQVILLQEAGEGGAHGHVGVIRLR